MTGWCFVVVIVVVIIFIDIVVVVVFRPRPHHDAGSGGGAIRGNGAIREIVVIPAIVVVGTACGPDRAAALGFPVPRGRASSFGNRGGSGARPGAREPS